MQLEATSKNVVYSDNPTVNFSVKVEKLDSGNLETWLAGNGQLWAVNSLPPHTHAQSWVKQLVLSVCQSVCQSSKF